MALVTMARPVSLVSQERDFAVCVLLDSLVTAVIQVGTNNMSPPCFISISVESVFAFPPLSPFPFPSSSLWKNGMFVPSHSRQERGHPTRKRVGKKLRMQFSAFSYRFIAFSIKGYLYEQVPWTRNSRSWLLVRVREDEASSSLGAS